MYKNKNIWCGTLSTTLHYKKENCRTFTLKFHNVRFAVKSTAFFFNHN